MKNVVYERWRGKASGLPDRDETSTEDSSFPVPTPNATETKTNTSTREVKNDQEELDLKLNSGRVLVFFMSRLNSVPCYW